MKIMLVLLALIGLCIAKLVDLGQGQEVKEFFIVLGPILVLLFGVVGGMLKGLMNSDREELAVGEASASGVWDGVAWVEED